MKKLVLITLYHVPLVMLNLSSGKGNKKVKNESVDVRIHNLPLLRLEDGSWVPLKFAEDCLFELEMMQVPMDLEINIVSKQIRVGSNRYRLFVAHTYKRYRLC